MALAKDSSRWDCFSVSLSSWKLFPRPPVRKPIFVCAFVDGFLAWIASFCYFLLDIAPFAGT